MGAIQIIHLIQSDVTRDKNILATLKLKLK